MADPKDVAAARLALADLTHFDQIVEYVAAQAARIAMLEAALREISRLTDGSSIDHIARRALASAEQRG